MLFAEQIIVGMVLVLAGWAVVRRSVGASLRVDPPACLDVLLPIAAFCGSVLATGKPVICGIALFALLAGIAHADRFKRSILREPILFVDIYQTVDVLFRHPQIDILTAANWRSLTAVSAGTATVVTALWFERPLWSWTPWPAAIFCAFLAGTVWAVAFPLLQRTARLLRLAGASGDPVADSARLGFFAMQIVHVVLARAERPERHAASRAAAGRPLRRTKSADGCPVIVVQSESFFDARRLSPDIPRDLLPAFDRHCGKAVQYGRLAVPGFGGNTMRTEFAVLTGLTEAAIGFDRFNPYQSFARKPVGSLAWRLRAEGYRTICIHPFDRRFYRRDLVMKNLGFDVFLGEEAFPRRAAPASYIPDRDVAALTLDLLREEGPRVFVFAITMQNHGPWAPGSNRFPGAMADRVPVLANDPALSSFIAGLHESDRMLETLSIALAGRGDDGLIAFYGDHLPGFRSTFDALGFADHRTDYVMTRSRAHAACQVDLAAHELPDAILSALAMPVSYRDRARVAGVSLHAR